MPPQIDHDPSATGGFETNDDQKKQAEDYEYNNNPPESFYLSKEAEYEWFDRNALFERKESKKGNTVVRSSSTTSQRFSINLRKSKASVIGLPKTQKSTFVVDSKRRTTTNVTLFPKRSDSTGKSRVLVEPGSPKVSCMGRVRSKRCRRRSNSSKRRDINNNNSSNKPVERSRSGKEKKKTGGGGLYSRVMSMFRSSKGSKKPVRSGSVKNGVEPRTKKSVSVNVVVGDEPAVEPPGLGGMKRFVSGRRTASWSGEEFS